MVLISKNDHQALKTTAPESILPKVPLTLALFFRRHLLSSAPFPLQISLQAHMVSQILLLIRSIEILIFIYIF
jgi:hypothetical protein